MRRLPAEWEPQSAVIIAWPHQGGDFVNLFGIEQCYRLIATTISRFQALVIICKNLEHRNHIAALLSEGRNIHYIESEYNDVWVRDTVFIATEENGHPLLFNFQFNGWGNKYPHDADNALNKHLFQHRFFERLPRINVDFVLEGGSLESDGKGTLLTTEECLLNPNRNPGFNQQAIADILQTHFNAKRILWLNPTSLVGDDTDAHIDTLARFCSEKIIAFSASNDPDDVHYASLNNMKSQLQTFKSACGDAYQLVELPLPGAIYNDQGQRLPANYANFLIINKAVLVPVYDDPMDKLAIARLNQCFPAHQIISVPCRPLIEQYGSLHCMSMHIPATVNLT